MRLLKPTILALTLITTISSTTLAGNIGGLRTSGNIGGLRTAGNIGGTRSAGNIGGMRGAATQNISPITNPGTSRLDLETAISGSFVGLIRMLLESGALL